MPSMSSCASGRHNPPASSAPCAYTRFPPTTGFEVSELLPAELELPLELLFLLLPQAATTSTSTRKRAVNRDLRDVAGFNTFPPREWLAKRVTRRTSGAAAAI